MQRSPWYESPVTLARPASWRSASCPSSPLRLTVSPWISTPCEPAHAITHVHRAASPLAFAALPVRLTWDTFGIGNGPASFEEMVARIGRYRRAKIDVHAVARAARQPLHPRGVRERRRLLRSRGLVGPAAAAAGAATIGRIPRVARRHGHPRVAFAPADLRMDGRGFVHAGGPAPQPSLSSTQFVKPWLESNTKAEMYVPSPTKKVSSVG